MKDSKTDLFEAIHWPEEAAPSRCPIHFTNEREVAASPETIWSLLTDPEAWPNFYPGVKEAPSCSMARGSYNLARGSRPTWPARTCS